MERVIVGLLIVAAVSPMAWACGPDYGGDSGGLLDLLLDVMTAPVAVLGELSGQGAPPYGYRGEYPKECIPAQCVPPKRCSPPSRRLDAPYYAVPARSYSVAEDGSYYECIPVRPKTRRISRRVQRKADCPECPPPRQVIERTSRLTESVQETVAKQPPKTIIVQVETKKKPAPPKEIIVTVETDKNRPSSKEPMVKVETVPKQPAGKEAVVKVETVPKESTSKETIVRVEIKQEEAAEPEPEKKKEKAKRKVKRRKYRGCVPYGVPYWWGTGSVR